MQQLFDFLNKSVSPYHAVSAAEEILQKNGFVRLNEQELWSLENGGKYYVTRNQSSILAFCIPEKMLVNYHMTASHSDSPTFRVKKNKADNKYYAKAEVEGYGGMIMSSWFDRPLSVAGRVVVKTNTGIEAKAFAIDKDVFVIPNLAIHFNRELNSGYKYNPQIDLQPIYGDKASDLQAFIEQQMNEEVLDMDLILTVRQPATMLGLTDEFFMSPRIDDLGCAYTTLEGFARAKVQEKTANIWCMFDNEEVGSGTRQGAMSSFLPDVLARIEESQQMSISQSIRARAKSLMISADNAHATHPNLSEKSDGEFPVILNKGIVIKYNASQKYTTTGMTAAIFETLCENAKVPVQHFANRADSPGGSTLGNLLSHQVSIPMLDIGLPQLAMHSAVETAGCQDVLYMKKVIEEFYESNICQTEDGKWQM